MVEFAFEIVNISKSKNIIAYATLICHRDIQLEVKINSGHYHLTSAIYCHSQDLQGQ